MHGANQRTLDERERDAFLAYSTAISGGFDKNNKPLIKSPKDLFDRAKVERSMQPTSGHSSVKAETVAKFKASKENAEAVLNRRRMRLSEGEEDINGE